jgi:RNAse (barnase) inhibitor barstar
MSVGRSAVARISIDWALVRTQRDFYESVLEQMAAPPWHGRNLDALNDSWVTGGVCASGPPYEFEFLNRHQLAPGLEPFARIAEALARESVREHGGRLVIAPGAGGGGA